MDYSLPDSSVHGIFQTRILEWLPFPSPGDLPNPGIKPVSPELSGGFFTAELPRSHQWNITQPWKGKVPFAETWMNLETVIQNEVRKRKTNILSPIVESIKWYRWTYWQSRNRFADEWRKKLWLLTGMEWVGKTGRLRLTIDTLLCIRLISFIDNWWKPIVEHREPYWMIRGDLNGKKIFKKWTYIYV